VFDFTEGERRINIKLVEDFAAARPVFALRDQSHDQVDGIWPWRHSGGELDVAKRDATLLALKAQEDAGIDIVTDALDRAIPKIDAEYSRRELGVQLHLLDILTIPIAEKARAGDQQAIANLMRLAERRSAVHGWDVAPAFRRDPAALQVQQAPQLSSTDRIEAALARIAGKELPPIDGEPPREEKPANSNGSDEPPTSPQ
jgi:hypothetical protein